MTAQVDFRQNALRSPVESDFAFDVFQVQIRLDIQHFEFQWEFFAISNVFMNDESDIEAE